MLNRGKANSERRYEEEMELNHLQSHATKQRKEKWSQAVSM
jgi:hypothetical protein